MALKTSKETLDTISYDQLGIQFDEGMVWERLESRLSPPTPAKYPIRWMVAAVLFLSVFFVPLTFLKESKKLGGDINVASTSSKMDFPLKESNSLSPSKTKILENGRTKKTRLWIPNVRSKGPDIDLAHIKIPEIKEVYIIPIENKITKPQFAIGDISVIQASLQDASVNDVRIEKGRKMSISAQWQDSPKNTEESLKKDSHGFSFDINLQRKKSKN